MTQVSLQAEPRAPGSRASRRLRRAGLVPGVVYGLGIEPKPVSVRLSDLNRLVDRAGRVQVVHLQVSGESSPRTILIKDTQWHRLLQRLEHADFVQVDLNRPTRVTVPVVVEGDVAVRKRGLVTLQQMNDVEIEGRPGDLPPALTLDISAVTEPGTAAAGALHLPPGVTLLTDTAAIICTITVPAAPAAAEEAEAAPASQLDAAAEIPAAPAGEPGSAE